MSRSYYNYFRHSGAQTGRYVESDPAGLRAGVNTFTYGRGSTSDHVDPNGGSPVLTLKLGYATGAAAAVANAYVLIAPHTTTLGRLLYDAVHSESDQSNVITFTIGRARARVATTPPCPPDDGCSTRATQLENTKVLTLGLSASPTAMGQYRSIATTEIDQIDQQMLGVR